MEDRPFKVRVWPVRAMGSGSVGRWGWEVRLRGPSTDKTIGCGTETGPEEKAWEAAAQAALEGSGLASSISIREMLLYLTSNRRRRSRSRRNDFLQETQTSPRNALGSR